MKFNEAPPEVLEYILSFIDRIPPWALNMYYDWAVQENVDSYFIGDTVYKSAIQWAIEKVIHESNA